MKKKKTKSAIPRKHRMEEPVWRSEAPKKSSSKLYYFDKRYYFNLKSKRWKRHIDGDWDNGPIISRVPLFPEQAVLSCCNASAGAVRFHISVPQETMICYTWIEGEGAPACAGTGLGFGKGDHCSGFSATFHEPLQATSS